MTPPARATDNATERLTRALFEDFEREHQKDFYSDDYRRIAAWIRRADAALARIEECRASLHICCGCCEEKRADAKRARLHAGTPEDGA